MSRFKIKFCWWPVRLARHIQRDETKPFADTGPDMEFIGWVWMQNAHLTNNLNHGWVAFLDSKLSTPRCKTCCAAAAAQQVELREARTMTGKQKPTHVFAESGLTVGLGGLFRRTVLWATGRDLLEPSLPTQPQGVFWTITGPPEPRWEMTLSADAYLKVSLPTGPNVFHRLTQRCVLGIRWRMLPKASAGK